MKGAIAFPSVSIPPVVKALTRRSLLFVLGLVTAGFVVYAIRTGMQVPVISNAMSNVQGYSLLEDGQFEQALEQFQSAATRAQDDANVWDSLGEGYLANGMPDKALESYSRALAIDPTFDQSVVGRGLALAALGRYGEALERPLPDLRAQAYVLSRAGRYREAAEILGKGIAADDDAEARASALLTSAWTSIEQQQFARALDAVRAAETALGTRINHSLLMLADLMGGIAEIRAGNTGNAVARLAAQKSRYTSAVPLEANWISALEGEIALAQGRYNEAVSSFRAAQQNAWMILGRDATTLFAMNLPSRDGLARVETARGTRVEAIQEYRRLTAEGRGQRTSAALEPRHVFQLARLLDENGDKAGAGIEYERFLKMWANADSGLPELLAAKRVLTDTP